MTAPAPAVAGTGAASEATEPTVPCADPRGCPDLVVDGSRTDPYIKDQVFNPDSCDVVEGTSQAGARRLLRFTFTTPNFGAGDLIIGSPPRHPEWFEFADCHGHFHFREFADYRLWKPWAFAQWDALRQASPHATPAELLAAHPEIAQGLTTAEKRGFCAIDVVQYHLVAPQKYVSCDVQGISVGWADEYGPLLEGQYVDVTDVQPGAYILETEVNAERFFGEMDYTNNRASRAVWLPGPDLVVADEDIVVAPGRDRYRSVSVTVANNGDTVAQAAAVRVLDGSVVIHEQAVTLGPGERRTVALTWDTAGRWRRILRVHVDPDDAVREIDETNNTATKEVDLRARDATA